MAAAAVTGQYRRGKTAMFLIACSWAGAAPHWLEAGKSLIPAIFLACVLGGYGLRNKGPFRTIQVQRCWRIENKTLF